jgi:hypothetical protein
MPKRKNDELLIIDDLDEVSVAGRHQRISITVAAVLCITAIVIVGVMVSILPGGRLTPLEEINSVLVEPVSEPDHTELFPVVRETILVPFDKIEPTYTEVVYSGVVTLQIFGSGQAGGKDYSDAFYLYKSGDGNLIFPPHLREFDLTIDGQRAIDTLKLSDNPPSYSSEHVYVVRYNVGSKPRPIAFCISDNVVDDNNGQFVIQILGTS